MGWELYKFFQPLHSQRNTVLTLEPVDHNYSNEKSSVVHLHGTIYFLIFRESIYNFFFAGEEVEDVEKILDPKFLSMRREKFRRIATSYYLC